LVVVSVTPPFYVVWQGDGAQVGNMHSTREEFVTFAGEVGRRARSCPALLP
jgi:hypothetical protein